MNSTTDVCFEIINAFLSTTPQKAVLSSDFEIGSCDIITKQDIFFFHSQCGIALRGKFKSVQMEVLHHKKQLKQRGFYLNNIFDS